MGLVRAGLTELPTGIAAGKTVHELANEASLGVGTIRQQLKSVFGKTGVSPGRVVAILVGSAFSLSSKTSVGGLA